MPPIEHATAATSPRIPVVGLVGGVGSGKSSVAKALAARAPIEIIDADKLGHRALELPALKTAIRQRFGDDVFDADGNIIRSEVAKLVFGNAPGAIAARKDLEAITHPEIGRLTHERIAEIQRENGTRWIVLDAALLLEADWRRFCDAVAFIDVPESIRVARVMQSRHWTREEWERREASQWAVSKKRAAADIVISNANTVEESAMSLQAALESRFPQASVCNDE